MKIGSYAFGSIRIDGQVYHSDVVIFPDKIISNWHRRQGHLVAIKDLEDVLEYKPEILIIGTGAYGAVKIESSLKEKLQDYTIELIEAPSDRACEIFNNYIEQSKKAVVALHLTC